MLSLVVSYSARAEFFKGPLATSLGGSGRAGLEGIEGVFLNPALVSLIQKPEMIAYYHDGYAAANQHRNAWGLGAVDAGKDVYFPGALNYIRLRDTGRSASAANGEAWHLSIGKNISDRFAIGLSGYRLIYDLEDGRDFTQWNASLGFLLLATEDIGVAYVLNNIAKPGSDVPMGLREDMNQALGVFATVFDMARLRFDVARMERHNPDKKLAYMLGSETMISDYFLFRAGYRRDELADQVIWTAGLGFNGPRLKIDYAFEKNAEGTGGAVHSVDMRVPF